MPRRFPLALLLCLGLLFPRPATPAGPAPGPPTLAPRTATLKDPAIPLSQALAELTKQTGIPVRDRRGTRSDPKLSLDLDRATFWQAVDAIAGQAKAGVSLYQPDGEVALVDPPARPLLVSHAGLFRSAVKRLTFTRDLETGAHSGVVYLEVAWEPPFQPLLLDVTSYEGTFAPDAQGHALLVKQAGTGQMDVQGRAAVVELALPAPDRSSPALAELKGRFTLIGSATMRTVRFDRLAQAAKSGKPQAQTPEEGVTVTLRKLDVLDTDHWQVEMVLAYPAGGPKFQSFQNWLVNNRIYLEKGKQRFEPGPADQQTLLLKDDRAVVRYDFVEAKGRPRLGRPGDWTLVYETPGRIVAVPGRFQFKALPLP